MVQDIFVRVWRYPDRYVEERGKFLGWLITVARNRSIDELRARRRQPLNESSVGGPESPTSIMGNTASEQAMREMEGAEMADQRLLVRQALADLPEPQRNAIELAYYKGLTQAEIAEALNTPLGTVKTRIRLGMQKLRTTLEGRVGLIEPGAADFTIAPSGPRPAEGSG